MAKEYIEREALISEFKRLTLGENSLIERVFADGVYAVIEQFPAADVAPAVELEDLRAKCQALVAEKDKNSGDTAETYTTGYRYGHRNGQIELLQQILGIFDGVSEPEET